MGFTDAVKTCFRKYATFSGRASRPEYWWFFLFVILGGIVASILDGLLFGATVVETETTKSVTTNGPLAAIFSLGTLVPGLAAGWRRMHDTGRSGLFLLYPLIVSVGVSSFAGLVGGFDQLASGDMSGLFAGTVGLVMIVALFVLMISPLLVLWWLTRPSQPGSNEYGPNPHEVIP
jgi:uncharacterized membrane protein YhaH (DUF805 family)